MTNENCKLDDIDLALIDVLQQDGTMTLPDIRDALIKRKITRDLSNLSRRIKRLQEENFITFRAVPNYERIGLPHITLVKVRIARTQARSLWKTFDAFEETIRACFPFVILSHKVDGEWSYVLKILARDRDHFEQMHVMLSNLEAVDDIETMTVIGQFIAPVPVSLIEG